MSNTASELPKRKGAPRLKGFNYTGSRAYFVTIGTWEREGRFQNAVLVDWIGEQLLRTAEGYGFDVLCYCFMPDHAHLVVVGATEKSDLKAFVRSFKQKTGFRFRRRWRTHLWQASYYDHVIRGSESLRDIVHYVLNNPVRRGLVTDWQAYEFSGGRLKQELAGSEENTDGMDLNPPAGGLQMLWRGSAGPTVGRGLQTPPRMDLKVHPYSGGEASARGTT